MSGHKARVSTTGQKAFCPVVVQATYQISVIEYRMETVTTELPASGADSASPDQSTCLTLIYVDDCDDSSFCWLACLPIQPRLCSKLVRVGLPTPLPVIELSSALRYRSVIGGRHARRQQHHARWSSGPSGRTRWRRELICAAGCVVVATTIVLSST